jgi:Calcium-dependent channel, 7TM region, putative phosphate
LLTSSLLALQLFAVFLSTVIAGSLLSRIDQIPKLLSDIMGLVVTVASAVPQQATFFMTWIMLNVRPPGLVLRTVHLV